MVKPSHASRNQGHVQSPCPCSSPTHHAAVDSSRSLCTRQTPIRQSRGLTTLRENYSQLLQEFAEWSSHSPNKQHRISGSDGAITPDEPCLISGAKNLQLLQQLAENATAGPNASRTSPPSPGLSSKQAAASAQAASSSFQQLNELSQQTIQQQTTSKHYSRRPSAAVLCTAGQLKASGKFRKPRRKGGPRPAWRNSIDVSSSQQQRHDTAAQQSHGLQMLREDVGVLLPSSPASGTSAVQQVRGAGEMNGQQQDCVADGSPGNTTYYCQQQLRPGVAEPDGVLQEQQVQQQQQDNLACTAGGSASAVSQLVQDVLNSRPTPAKPSPSTVPSAAAKTSSSDRLASSTTAEPAAVQQLAESAAQTGTATPQHKDAIRLPHAGTDTVQATDKAVPHGAEAIYTVHNSSQTLQQQQRQQTRSRRQRVGAINAATALQAAADIDHVVTQKVPALPLQQLQSTGGRAAASAGQARGARAGSGKISSSAPATAHQSRSSTSSSPVTTRQQSTRVEPTATDIRGAAGRDLSSKVAATLPAWLTYRRHSAADADQALLEATLSPAGAATCTQLGRATAAGAASSSSSDMGVSSSDPLQHIKQLQAQRRRSVGLQHIEPGPMLCAISTAGSISCAPLAAAPAAQDSSLAAAALPAGQLLLPTLSGSFPDYELRALQPLHHRRPSSQGGSRSMTGQTAPAHSSSSGAPTPRGSALVVSSGATAVLPELKPSRAGSRRSSSTQLPRLDEGTALACVAAPAPASNAGQSVLPPIITAGSRRVSRGDGQDSSTAGHSADGSSSSRQQLLLPTSNTCSAQVVLRNNSSSSSSSNQQVVIESVGNSSSQQLGFAHSEISNGMDDPAPVSSPSSSCDEGTGHAGLCHELSSYGVCGDNPAGAVPLSRGAMPHKLAQLKAQRISSKHTTADEDSQPAQGVQGFAETSGLELLSGAQGQRGTPWPPAAPTDVQIAAATTAAATAAGARTCSAAAAAAAAVSAADSCPAVLSHAGHHGHSKSASAADRTSSQHRHHAAPDRSHRAVLTHTVSEHQFPAQQQQQQQQDAGALVGRVRARWRLPVESQADRSKQQSSTVNEQVQQSLPGLIHKVPHKQQQQVQRWHPSEPWQLPEDCQQQQQQQQQPSSPPAPARAWSIKQPALWEQQQQQCCWQQQLVHQQHSQHEKFGGTDYSQYADAQQHWWQHQQHWQQQQQQQCGAMQGHERQPGQQRMLQQQQYWTQQQQQQQQLAQLQQWGPLPPWRPWQQQQPQGQGQGQGPVSSVVVLPGALPPLPHVPPQHSMPLIPSQLPNTDDQGLMQPLQAHHSPAAGPTASAVSNHLPLTGPAISGGAAAATAAALTALSAAAAAMSGPGGFVAPLPASGALSVFSDPWADKQQQQQQARQNQQQSPPPVTSAAAMARQRQEELEVAFEGLSLEAVLRTAKKAKPPPFVGRTRLSATGADNTAS